MTPLFRLLRCVFGHRVLVLQPPQFLQIVFAVASSIVPVFPCLSKAIQRKKVRFTSPPLILHILTIPLLGGLFPASFAPGLRIFFPYRARSARDDPWSGCFHSAGEGNFLIVCATSLTLLAFYFFFFGVWSSPLSLSERECLTTLCSPVPRDAFTFYS